METTAKRKYTKNKAAPDDVTVPTDDVSWWYAKIGRDGVTVLQPVEILTWDGSIAAVVTSQAADGRVAIPVGRATRVSTDDLFRGKGNVVYATETE